MRVIWKTVGIMVLLLALYVGATSGISWLICLLFGLTFDFFISLFFWFFVPFLVLCLVVSYEGGVDDGRSLEDDRRL